MIRLASLLLTTTAVVLFGSAAGAADLGVQPVYKAVPAPTPLTYDWRGFYVGGHIGGVNSTVDSTTIDIATGTGKIDSSSFMGGGQVGYNFMLTPSWRFGVEADVSATSLRARQSSVVGAAVVNYARNNDLFGTVRGRVGYAANNWLFYGTGGFAWSNERVTRTQVAGVVNGAVPGISESASATLGGWVVGGGIEYGLTPNISIKAEYLHFGFERSGTTFPVAGRRWDDAVSKDTVKIGVNWRLNWAP